MPDTIDRLSKDAEALARRMMDYAARFEALGNLLEDDPGFVGLGALNDQMVAIHQRLDSFPNDAGAGVGGAFEYYHRGLILGYLDAYQMAHHAIGGALADARKKLADDGDSGLGQSSSL